MKKAIIAAAALGAGASAAEAGGIERSALSTGILFEEGNYVEFTFGRVMPDVSGAQVSAVGLSPGAGQSSGNMSPSYNQLSFGYKNDLTDRLHLALILDSPIGADVAYPTGTGYIYGGSTANVDSLALTALLRYELQNNVSVYGGLRVQQAEGQVALFNGYTMSTSKETDLGYIIGAAWEKPEIAARVALTYQSEITHDFDATENIDPTNAAGGFSTTVPQSLTLEFQSGVAADTLVFGSIKWTEWTEFNITPAALGSALVDYDDDVITYNLGVGRRFNDEWSGALLLGHEKSNGGFSGNLGPTDGYTSAGVAVTRTIDNVEVTAGARYIWIGDAETQNPVASGTTLGDFDDNDGWAFGLRVGYSF